MRELQTAELSLVTGGQTAPSGTGSTTTTNTNVSTNTQGVTGNLTFGPGGQPTGGTVGYTWTSGSTTTTTTVTTTPNPPANDPRDTTPRQPIRSDATHQDVLDDLQGLY